MIYILSDIHGHRERFDSLMRQINLQPEDTLYVLGDVIDRNADGIAILRQLMAMPNVKMLLGNHEYMMLNALYHPCGKLQQMRNLELWYRNGGEITHDAWKCLQESERIEIFEYLAKLPINEEVELNGERFLLTHAAPLDWFEGYRNRSRFKNAKEFALWHRFHGGEVNLSGRTVIFGHSGTYHYQQSDPMKIWHGIGLIGIDCGAAYSDEQLCGIGCRGRLACLRLDDGQEFYSE